MRLQHTAAEDPPTATYRLILVRAYATVLRPSSVVVCNVMYCGYWQPTGSRIAYDKRNRLVSKEWPWSLFRGRLRSPKPLSHVRHSILRKPLEIEPLFQRNISRKWPMGNQLVTYPMTLRDPERSSREPNMLRVQYSENSWKCYLATIANY